MGVYFDIYIYEFACVNAKLIVQRSPPSKYTYMYVYMYVCMYVCIYIYIHTYTYIYGRHFDIYT